VPPWAIVAGVALESAQTSLAALAWYGILRAALPAAVMPFRLILEKIPFSVFNVALYLYLFLTVSGSFSIKLGFLADHTGLVAMLVVGAIVLLVLLARIFWECLEKLRSPRRTATRLFLPVLGSYPTRLAIVAVSWVFGWSGGKELVESSYGEAKERSRELRKRRSAASES
jgi:hypothetical protein